jgi:hypothetical protein
MDYFFGEESLDELVSDLEGGSPSIGLVVPMSKHWDVRPVEYVDGLSEHQLACLSEVTY